MTNSPLTIRDLEDGDAGFIWDSWLKAWKSSQRYCGQHASELEMRDSDWFPYARAGIERIIHDPDVMVRVACLAEVPDEVAGYVVARPSQGRLDWILIRRPYRSVQLLRRLVRSVFPEVPRQLIVSYLTPPVIAFKHCRKMDLRYIPA